MNGTYFTDVILPKLDEVIVYLEAQRDLPEMVTIMLKDYRRCVKRGGHVYLVGNRCEYCSAVAEEGL